MSRTLVSQNKPERCKTLGMPSKTNALEHKGVRKRSSNQPSSVALARTSNTWWWTAGSPLSRYEQRSWNASARPHGQPTDVQIHISVVKLDMAAKELLLKLDQSGGDLAPGLVALFDKSVACCADLVGPAI
jgi:hypothetical protein